MAVEQKRNPFGTRNPFEQQLGAFHPTKQQQEALPVQNFWQQQATTATHHGHYSVGPSSYALEGSKQPAASIPCQLQPLGALHSNSVPPSQAGAQRTQRQTCELPSFGESSNWWAAKGTEMYLPQHGVFRLTQSELPTPEAHQQSGSILEGNIFGWSGTGDPSAQQGEWRSTRRRGRPRVDGGHDDGHEVPDGLSREEVTRYRNWLAQKRFIQRQRALIDSLEREVEDLRSQLNDLKVQNTALQLRHADLKHKFAATEDVIDQLQKEASKHIDKRSGSICMGAQDIGATAADITQSLFANGSAMSYNSQNLGHVTSAEAHAMLYSYFAEFTAILGCGTEPSSEQWQRLVQLTKQMTWLRFVSGRVSLLVSLRNVSRWCCTEIAPVRLQHTDQQDGEWCSWQQAALASVQLPYELRREMACAQNFMVCETRKCRQQIAQLVSLLSDTKFDGCGDNNKNTDDCTLLQAIRRWVVRERFLYNEFLATVATKILEAGQVAQLMAASFPGPFDLSYASYLFSLEFADLW